MAHEGLRRWVEVDSGNLKLMIISKMHKIDTPSPLPPLLVTHNGRGQAGSKSRRCHTSFSSFLQGFLGLVSFPDQQPLERRG